VLPYSATKRITVFKTTRGRDATYGREEVNVSSRHTCLEGEAIEDIRNILEWRGMALCWDHQFRTGGLAAAVLTLAAVFFLDFAAVGLEAAVDLGSGFLGAVTVSLGFL
jgi:hypothetical protein